MERSSKRLILVFALLAGVVAFLVVSLASLPGSQRLNRKLVFWTTVVVLTVLLFVVFRLRGRSKGRALDDAARENDLRLIEQPAKDFHKRYPNLPLRSSGATSAVLTGAIDLGHAAPSELVIFQHTYVIHTGQGSYPVIRSVYVIEAPDWPEVTIKPRNGFGRLFYRLGRRTGLQMENPRFGLRFHVRCADEVFPITLLSPEVQRFMLEKPSMTWKLGGGLVAMIYSGRLKPEKITASIDRMGRFWALVPPELDAWEA